MLDFSKNHFDLFGLPTSFRVDRVLLAERYRVLQHKLHPDRYAAAGDREKRLSMQASTRVNEAYETLKDPLQRARYLIRLQDGDTTEQKETTRDTTFLMEQMELREALAEVKEQPDPIAAVGKVLDQLADQAGALISELEALLEALPAKELEAARELVYKLQFVAKCRVEAEDLEAELEESL